MKVWGYVLLILGALSFIGALMGGSSPVGGLFWTVLGVYLLSRAKKKEEEKKDKENWMKGN